MAKSKITLTFTADLLAGDIVDFYRYKLVTPATRFLIRETFIDTTRTESYFIPVNPGVPAGNNTALLYKLFLNLDYGSYLTATVLGNVVSIELDSLEWGFDAVSLPASVSYSIENNPVQSFQFIGDSVFSQATEVCTKVNTTLETTELATKIYINGVLTNSTNTINPVTIPILRGIQNQIILENASGDKLYYPNVTYDLFGNMVFLGGLKYDFLTPENITVTVNQSINGASVSVSVINTIGLELESSLDNVNWFPITKVYTGQDEGTKTMYVKDQFGCIKSKEFLINALGTRNPFLFISVANGINYSEIEAVDNCTTFKNDNNTLAYESNVSLPYCSKLLFNTCDKPQTQIKSNYETVTAILRKYGSADVPIPITKMSNNINRYESLDGWYYKYRDGKLGIYFESGNKYNKEDEVIGTYTLNGNLPDFAIVGQYINVFNIGYLEIKDVLYDETINKRVIIVDYFYEGEPLEAVIWSQYDLLNFEVYEFVIDFSLYGIGTYDVVLTNTDSINGTVVHNSENISILDEHYKTLHIRYFNNNNRDIFYKYGIENIIRIPFIHISGKTKQESEINISDNMSSVTKSSVYELDEFIFDDVTKEIMRKLVVALSCDNVFINGIGYIKEDSVSVENVPNTNLYEVKVVMIKTNINYNNNRQGQSGFDLDYNNIEIPSIITDGTNFIKS